MSAHGERGLVQNQNGGENTARGGGVRHGPDLEEKAKPLKDETMTGNKWRHVPITGEKAR